MTTSIGKWRATDGCQGWPFWGGAIRRETWVIQKRAVTWRTEDKRGQMQKPMVEIDFEIFEE